MYLLYYLDTGSVFNIVSEKPSKPFDANVSYIGSDLFSLNDLEKFDVVVSNNRITSSLKPVSERMAIELEKENAQLWYENMITKSKLNQSEEDVAELWYTIIMGGVVNV